MSRQIDWTKPLSKADREWAEQFPGLYGGSLQANEEQFPREHGGQEPTLDGEDDDTDVAPYPEWSVRELSAEAKRRNAEEGTSLVTSGTKDALVKVLEEDDAARPVVV